MSPPLALLLAGLAAVMASSRLSGLRAPHVDLSWLEPVDQADQLDQVEQGEQGEQGEQAGDERPALAVGLAALGLRGCFSPHCADKPKAASSTDAKGLGRDASAAEAEQYEEAEEGAVDNAVDNLIDNLAEERVEAPPPKRTTLVQDLADLLPCTRGGGSLLPCRCHEGFHPMELGEAHYPRTLSAAVCVQSPHCQPYVYHVPVLTHKDRQTQSSQGGQPAPLVPDSLRKHWHFEYKAVPVACECVLQLTQHGQHAQHHVHYDGRGL